jgi:hypothetical protein
MQIKWCLANSKFPVTCLFPDYRPDSYRDQAFVSCAMPKDSYLPIYEFC